MRILQVLLTLSAGGTEGFTTNLSVALSEAGAEVKVFLLAGLRGERGRALYDRLQETGVEVVGGQERGRGVTLSNLAHFVRLPLLIRRWKPDIVQVNHRIIEIPCAVARILSLGSGACFTRRLASTKQTSAYRSMTIARIMDRIYLQTIVCSPAVAAAYRDFMGEQHRSSVVTIANGGKLLDSVPGIEEKYQARRELDVPEEAFVVTHIGRIRGEGAPTLSGNSKAQDVLLKAFSQAFGSDSDCRLLLVGDGPLRADAEKLARELGLENRARFLGFVPEPWPALKAADMFCFPSRYEGLPNVLPEAASAGLPVVASDIPEISSLSPGDAWLLEPVDDVAKFAAAMRRVRDNHDEFSHMATDAAAGFRERFSMAACAGKYLQAYDKVCSSEKR